MVTQYRFHQTPPTNGTGLGREPIHVLSDQDYVADRVRTYGRHPVGHQHDRVAETRLCEAFRGGGLVT